MMTKYIKAPANELITDSEYAFQQFMAGNVELEDLIYTNRGLEGIATIEELTYLIESPYLVVLQADIHGVDEDTIIKQAKQLLTAINNDDRG